MRKGIAAILCLLAPMAPVVAADVKPTQTQIAGRWTGGTYDPKIGSPITLDIVACATGWCGIKVEAGDKCGGTALKVEYVEPLGPPSNSLQFDGTFEVAAGTEPYVVRAWLVPPSENHPLHLQIAGDTGGIYREYRRSFQFEAQMVRVGDAVCHAPATVSSLDQD